jgi:hypothetical protein
LQTCIICRLILKEDLMLRTLIFSLLILSAMVPATASGVSGVVYNASVEKISFVEKLSYLSAFQQGGRYAHRLKTEAVPATNRGGRHLTPCNNDIAILSQKLFGIGDAGKNRASFCVAHSEALLRHCSNFHHHTGAGMVACDNKTVYNSLHLHVEATNVERISFIKIDKNLIIEKADLPPPNTFSNRSQNTINLISILI